MKQNAADTTQATAALVVHKTTLVKTHGLGTLFLFILHLTIL
jgi:hypothetical protein